MVGQIRAEFSYQLDIRDEDRLTTSFSQFDQLARTARFATLSYPRDWGALDEVCEFLLRVDPPRGHASTGR